jgi:transposase
MPWPNDSRRSLLALEQESTLIVVVELSRSSWLVAGIVPGLERHPLKKLEPDEDALLRLLQRWREEAARAGRTITRVAVAFEAGRDGFWLARWLRARDVEAYVIHPSSVPVPREHRRAKTDRLDTELLKRAFLGWLRGEPDHCSMAAVPTLEEEDARRPNRERESLVGERTRIVNRMKGNLARLGIRGFKPTLRKAPERLEALRTPEGAPLPPNTAAELRRDMARLRVVAEQIRSGRSRRRAWGGWGRNLRRGRTRWCACWLVSSASASRQPTCWCTRSCRATSGTGGRWRATPASPGRRTRAAPSGGRRGSPRPATRGCAAA